MKVDDWRVPFHEVVGEENRGHVLPVREKLDEDLYLIVVYH